MYKTILSAFLVTIISFASFSQSSEIDSLTNALKNSRGTDRADALNSIASFYYFKNIDSSFYFAKKSLFVSDSLNYPMGRWTALNRLGLVSLMQGEMEPAKERFYQVIHETKLIDSVELGRGFHHLGLTYRTEGNLDSAMIYLKKSLEIDLMVEDSTDLAKSYYELGVLYGMKDDYENASKNYQKSYELSQKIPDDTPWLALVGLGILQAQLGQYDSSLIYFQKVKQLVPEDDYLNQSIASTNIGSVYLETGDYSKAQEYMLQALAFSEKIDDREGITYALRDLGTIFYRIGDYRKAEEYFQRSIESAKRSHDLVSVASAQEGLGVVYNETDQLPKAIKLLSFASHTFDSLGMITSSLTAKIAIGDIYLKQQRYDLASTIFQACLTILDDLGTENNKPHLYNQLAKVSMETASLSDALRYRKLAVASGLKTFDREELKEAYKGLSETYDALNQPIQAYQFIKQYYRYKDSLINEENLKTINQLQIQYETEKKEQQITSLNQQARIQELELSKKDQELSRMALAGIILLLLLVISILLILFFNYRKRLKAKQERTALEQKLLRTQMNPHFLFNSLMSIQKFIYQNKADEGVAYIAKFARLVRLILENSRDEYISMEREIETLELYLELQKVRLGAPFDYEIIIDPSMEPEMEKVPPMFAQPFIENTIEHGFNNLPHKGLVTIGFGMREDKISFTIEDNGTGLKKEAAASQTHRSLAIDITKERLSHLYKGGLQKAQFTIKNRTNQQESVVGTHVSFVVPIYRLKNIA
ncbi:MAG: tetratricopeptide repeat protein [Bacteroidota bacterium]